MGYFGKVWDTDLRPWSQRGTPTGTVPNRDPNIPKVTYPTAAETQALRDPNIPKVSYPTATETRQLEAERNKKTPPPKPEIISDAPTGQIGRAHV